MNMIDGKPSPEKGPTLNNEVGSVSAQRYKF